MFKARADPPAKARWFVGPEGWKEDIRTQDFGVGGVDRLRGTHPGGRVSDFQAQYRDIVPDTRIVYTYDMYVDAQKISVSLATVELEPAGGGTRMRVTERAVFLDGYDDAGSRERGTAGLLDRSAGRWHDGLRMSNCRHPVRLGWEHQGRTPCPACRGAPGTGEKSCVSW